MRISDWSSDVCSSDLRSARDPSLNYGRLQLITHADRERLRASAKVKSGGFELGRRPVHLGIAREARSEEHTSELQSLMRISYAVFCLKKKKQHKKHTHTNI